MSAAKFCKRKWQLLVLTPPVIFISASRPCSYSTVFPLRCRDDAISYTRFFYAHTSYIANFARVEKLRFSLAFLYVRFNFFYVKYHASAACHGEINFSTSLNAVCARKIVAIETLRNSVRERNKGRKSPREWNIVFVVQTTYLPSVRKAYSGLTVKYHELRDRSARLSSPEILFEFTRDR